jgi:SAM-dependent methyltransferase
MDAAETRAYYATVAPLYDTELAARDDLPCWLALVEEWKPRQTIEYGCGTGRVAVPLALQCAQWGGDVAGLDLSPAMLDLAHQHWRRLRGDAPASALRLRVGDMRRASLGHAVDLAIFADDPLTHLATCDDHTATFRRVGEHLLPGGRLVVEVSLLPPEVRGQVHPVVVRHQHGVPSPAGVMQVEEERRLDPAKDRAHVTYRYRTPPDVDGGDDIVTEARFIAHYLDLPRLNALFNIAGCRIEERWSDFHFGALSEDSRMVLCTGRKL